MDLHDRLGRLVSGLPEGASVTLPREVLVSWLADEGEGRGGKREEVDVADLTVPQISKAVGRSESTVRGWLRDVQGAYKLGGEWRVPRRAWRAFLDSLGAVEEPTGVREVKSNRAVSLGDWREAREARDRA